MEIQETCLVTKFNGLTLNDPKTSLQTYEEHYKTFPLEEIHFLCSEKRRLEVSSPDHMIFKDGSLIGLRALHRDYNTSLEELAKNSKLKGVKMMASLFQGELMVRSPKGDIRLDHPIADIVYETGSVLKRLFFERIYRSTSQENPPYYVDLILADSQQSEWLEEEGYEEVDFSDNPFLTYRDAEDDDGDVVRRFYCVKNYHRGIKTYVNVLNLGDVYFKGEIRIAKLDRLKCSV